MLEHRRRLGLNEDIARVKAAINAANSGEKLQVAIEALIDIMRDSGITYWGSGCRDYDFKLDIRPLEERK